MVLTRDEKIALVLPILLALLIAGVAIYSKHVSSRQQLIHEMIVRTNTRINADQERLYALQDFAESERFHHQYRLNEWIPMFNNPLEVELFLNQKTQRGLSAVGAKKADCNFEIPQSVTTPRIGEFYVHAIFPSYQALVTFLRAMEDAPPPALPQEVEIIKAGITIETMLTFYFGYRLYDEAV